MNKERIIVWLGVSEISTDNLKAVIETHGITGKLEIFWNIDECINYIKSTINAEVYLILHASLAETVITLIDDLTEIQGIYFFFDREIKTDQLAGNPLASRLVHGGIEQLCSHLQNELSIEENDTASSLPISATSNNLHRQEPTFMYSQLLKDVLLSFPKTNESKEEMLDYCRGKYFDNKAQLSEINRFEKEFCQTNALWWYTRDCFLYRVLNEALREQNIDALYKTKYCLPFVDQQIAEKHNQWRLNNPHSDELIVYRGFKLSVADFKSIKKKIGGFMSIASFLSTSVNRDVAYGFVFPLIGVTEIVAVLLEIVIDVKNCKTAFADLGNESMILEEQEILLTMGAVFRVESVELHSQGFWIIRLKLTGEEDQELKEIYEHMKKQIRPQQAAVSPLMNLANLAFLMGKYNESIKFHHKALDHHTVRNNAEFAKVIYHNLGITYDVIEDIEKAIEHSETSLGILISLGYSVDEDIRCASTYRHLGSHYRRKHDYSKALFYHYKTLTLHLKESSPKTLEIAMDYNNIAQIYDDKGEFSTALNMYDKSLELSISILPKNHPTIATIYSNIAKVYYGMKNFKKVEEYSRKALEIYQTSLPPTHPDIGKCYYTLGGAVAQLCYFQEALIYSKKAKVILSQCLPPTDPMLRRVNLAVTLLTEFNKAACQRH